MKLLFLGMLAVLAIAASPAEQDSQSKSAPSQLEFFDKPQFIVSGVTDYTYRGGHGSDSVLRSTEALTKATALLGNEPVMSSMPLATAASMEESLREKLVQEPPKAALHHELAVIEERLGNSVEAVQEYQRAAELNASEDNLFDWGTELLTHRAGEPAIEVFREGNRLFPNSTRMLLGLGAAFYLRGDYDHAALHLFAAADLHPENPKPYLFLGKVQVNQITQTDGYRERLARFATMRPNDAWANYYYAACLWRGKANLEDLATMGQVRILAEKAIGLDPKLSAAYLLLGIVYSSQKDLTHAIEAYQKAAEANPESEEPHYRLSHAYELLGEKAKAQRELDTYKRLSDKSSQESKQERRELQQFVFTLRDVQKASEK